MTMKSKEVLGVGVALSTLVTSRSIFAQTDRTHMCCSEPLGTEPKNFARGAVKHARITPRGGVWQWRCPPDYKGRFCAEASEDIFITHQYFGHNLTI
jgi:hypothetical protein